MLPWIQKFNPYDLHSKGSVKPNMTELKPYYKGSDCGILPAQDYLAAASHGKAVPVPSRPLFAAINGKKGTVVLGSAECFVGLGAHVKNQGPPAINSA